MSTYTRKATFSVAKVNGQRTFTAINKPAQRVAKKLGKRTRHATVTLAQLKSTVGKGSYKFYQYANGKDSTDGLTAIKF